MLKHIAERFVFAVDCGVTAFVNELYQFKILAPLQEPELTADELIAVRQLIEDRWPLQTKSWPESETDVGALIREGQAQIREYAAHTATPHLVVGEDTRRDIFSVVPEDGPTPASNGVPSGCHSTGVGPLTVDELHTAAGAIRCWLHGLTPDNRLLDDYALLADRLSTAAFDQTHVN